MAESTRNSDQRSRLPDTDEFCIVSTGREYGEPQSKNMISAIVGAAELYDCTPNKEYEGYYDH